MSAVSSRRHATPKSGRAWTWCPTFHPRSLIQGHLLLMILKQHLPVRALCLCAGAFFASSLFAQTAYVDFLGAGYESSVNITTVQTLTGDQLIDDGYTGLVPSSITPVELYDYTTGQTTGWTLSITATDMQYRTHSFTENKDAGAEVTSGDAYTTFGSINYEWDGVMRALDGSTANSQLILTFTGLSAEATYDFALLHNYRNDKLAGPLQISLSNADGSSDGALSTVELSRGNGSGAMVSFTELDPGSDGTISVTVFSPSAGDFYVQGFALTQVSAVPEPAETAAILGVLGLGFVFWRRRRTASSIAG